MWFAVCGRIELWQQHCSGARDTCCACIFHAGGWMATSWRDPFQLTGARRVPSNPRWSCAYLETWIEADCYRLRPALLRNSHVCHQGSTSFHLVEPAAGTWITMPACAELCRHCCWQPYAMAAQQPATTAAWCAKRSLARRRPHKGESFAECRLAPIDNVASAAIGATRAARQLLNMSC